MAVVKKVIGAISLVWGILMTGMLYPSISNAGEEVTGMIIALSVLYCAFCVGLGILLLWPKKKLKAGTYLMGRH